MLSVIIPTYNERKNVVSLTMEVQNALSSGGITDYEILFMDDDSPDGTAAVITALKDPRVRVVNRRGRPRGLAYAVIDGFREGRGEIFAVMDADLSHPPKVLPALVRAVMDGAEIAVGSRYVKGGGVYNWPWKRRFVSRVACLMARPVTPVRDSTSGFFAIRRSAIEGVTLNPYGFKIGLEVFVCARHQGKIQEVPYVFTDRREGTSKLGGMIMWLYLKQLGHLLKKKFR